MHQYRSKLSTWDLKDTRILIRADLNMPLNNGIVINDFRLKGFLPTLTYVTAHAKQVIIITHLGRPKNPCPELSTQNIIPLLASLGFNATFAETIEAARISTSKLILLENLRFFPGEKERSSVFAENLATLATHYVNDAFGSLHRNDTSITLLANLFLPEKKTFGFLVERELNTITSLLHKPKKPYCIILGGGKVTDKIPFIKTLIHQADTILLCPAIALTFLHAQGICVGQSLVDKTNFSSCLQLIKEATKLGVNLMLPIDYQIADNTIDGPLSFVSADAIPKTGIAISIGPKTAVLFDKIIKGAKTVLLNGAIGFMHKKETLSGMQSIMQAMSEVRGSTIIAGGDAVTAACLFEKRDAITHLSTGGGATLALITESPLPGLTSLGLKHRTKTQK